MRMIATKLLVFASLSMCLFLGNFGQPGPHTPIGWNEPGVKDYNAITLFVNCTCPELIVTAVEYSVRLFVSVVALKAEGATHANIVLRWSWFHHGAPTPGYLSSEISFTNVTAGQNCIYSDDLYVHARAVGIFPGQLGTGYLMLSYRVSFEVYNHTELLGGGFGEVAEDIPVIGGVDATEVANSWVTAIALGTGLTIAIIAGIYYLRRED